MDHVAKRLAEKLAAENYNFDAFEAGIATNLLGDLIRNLPYIADNKHTLDIAHRNLLTLVRIDVDDPATWPQNITFCDQIFDHICTVSRPGMSGDSRSWEDSIYGTCEQVPR